MEERAGGREGTLILDYGKEVLIRDHYAESRLGAGLAASFAVIEACRYSKKLRFCFVQVAIALHILSWYRSPTALRVP